MTTERDIRNQIRYAEEKGIEKGLKEGKIAVARQMREDQVPVETVVRYTGLTEEQVQAL